MIKWNTERKSGAIHGTGVRIVQTGQLQIMMFDIQNQLLANYAINANQKKKMVNVNNS